MKPSTQHSGFSLIELALVLAIVSIFIGFGLESVTTTLNVDAAEVTKQRMDRIKDELDRYGGNNLEYPCPALKTLRPGVANGAGPQYGEEDCTGALTLDGGAILHGLVPVRALNLADSYSIDGWGNKFTYVVSRDNTSENPSLTAGQTAFTNGTGTIHVHYGTPPAVDPPAPTANQITDQAAYVLLSHGANGSAANGGATGEKETTAQTCTANSSPDSINCAFSGPVFFEAPRNINQNATAGGFFDDYIIFRLAQSAL